MGADGTGSIYIPLAEFWTFAQKYGPKLDGEVVYGVPRIENDDLVIDYAFSTEAHPSSWAKKPDSVVQWEDHKKKGG